jgi:hypothetical protein
MASNEKETLSPPNDDAENAVSSSQSQCSQEFAEKKDQPPEDSLDGVEGVSRDLEAGLDHPEEKTPAAPPASEFGPPPDGGWDAWFVVAGGFCTIFASFGWINCA